jgi:sugar O-acyltransferase (sialic acid O-acetyltransferase NeuD family)
MKLAILGAGGHAKVVAATATACGYELVGFLDDDSKKWTTELQGIPVMGPMDMALRLGFWPAIQGVGSNEMRLQLARRFASLEWVSVVHPTASMHASVRIGPGTVVFAGTVLQPDSRIGAHVIINTAATVDHDCIVGDYSHLAPGVHLAGHVRVGTGVFLGIGAVVVPRVTIGDWAVVGAGAVVTRDVLDRSTVVGVPARPVKN